MMKSFKYTIGLVGSCPFEGGSVGKSPRKVLAPFN